MCEAISEKPLEARDVLMQVFKIDNAWLSECPLQNTG